MMKFILSTLCVTLLCHTASASDRKAGQGRCLERLADRIQSRDFESDIGWLDLKWLNPFRDSGIKVTKMDKAATCLHDGAEACLNGTKWCLRKIRENPKKALALTAKAAAITGSLYAAHDSHLVTSFPPLSASPWAKDLAGRQQPCIDCHANNIAAVCECPAQSEPRDTWKNYEEPPLSARLTAWGKENADILAETTADTANGVGNYIYDTAAGAVEKTRSVLPHVYVGYDKPFPTAEDKPQLTKEPKSAPTETDATPTKPNDTVAAQSDVVPTESEGCTDKKAEPTMEPSRTQHKELNQFALAPAAQDKLTN